MRFVFPPGTAGLYGMAGTVGRGCDPRATVRLARALLDAGVKVLQLREKEADGRTLAWLAHELCGLAHEASALFIVNDRLDVALMSEADGVHVGQQDLPAPDVRRVVEQAGVRRPFLVGVSTHDFDQLRQAIADGADYVGFGPVYATATKDNPSPVCGCERLAQAVRLAGDVPVVAIGGITLERAPEVAATGARFAAVVADVAHAPDPRERAAALHAALLSRA